MPERSLIQILKDDYLLLLIVLLGLALRIYDLAGESVWFDEAVSIYVSKLDFIEQIKWVAGQSKEGNPRFTTWCFICGSPSSGIRKSFPDCRP
ncbi:MAG: hypothetical protein R3B51_00075 [Thermodesulfobacteriota bacterium]